MRCRLGLTAAISRDNAGFANCWSFGGNLWFLGTIAARRRFSGSRGVAKKEAGMSAVRAMLRSHPEKPSHADVLSKCIDSCLACLEICTTCADACLSEKDVERLTTCIRLNLDCTAICSATATVMARANKVGHRQLLEAQLTTCVAFCRACASECERHGAMHKHCQLCAATCTACAEACSELLASMRMAA
jgi:hypothetical protein